MKKLINSLKSMALAPNAAAVSSNRRYLTPIIGLVAVFFGTSLTAGSVQAQAIEGRLCTVSGYLSFEAPLSKQDGEHQVYGEATISACVDENGPIAEAGAEVVFSGQGTANCMLQAFNLQQLVQWNSGGFDLVTLQPSSDGRAPLGSYKGEVDFGTLAGSKAIALLFNEEPLQTLNCLMGVDPIGTFNFNGVQVFTNLDESL